MTSLSLYAGEKNTYVINNYEFEVEGNVDEMSIGDLTIEVAKNFLGTPYKGGTLEGETEFPCEYDFEGLDCVTFVENSLAANAWIRMHSKGKYDFRRADASDEIATHLDSIEVWFGDIEFCGILQKFRYSGLNGLHFGKTPEESAAKYQDRLHYSSEWIYFNTHFEYSYKDITLEELSGEPYDVDVYFMSKNRHLYPRPLKEDDEVYEAIKANEVFISKQEFYYVPQEKIASIEDKLQNGDIIFVTSSIAGLDYNHVGFVYVDEDGTRRLMHASSSKSIRKVIIGKRISDYVNDIKKHTGFTVLRSRYNKK